MVRALKAAVVSHDVFPMLRSIVIAQGLYCTFYRRYFIVGKGAKKKEKKKLTSVSFMYVYVAGNGEMLVFFLPFFPQQKFDRQFSFRVEVLNIENYIRERFKKERGKLTTTGNMGQYILLF